MPKKPNILFIMADQLRYDVIQPQYTPNLCALQSESICFDNAYCASPLCVPARGALFTGLYPNLNGCLINPWEDCDAGYGQVKGSPQNLYALLQQDWDSHQVGKQHFLTEERIDQSPDYHIRFEYTDKDYRRFLKENGKRSPGGDAFRSLVPEMAMGRYTRAVSYSNPHTACYPEEERFYFDSYFAKGAVKAIHEHDKTKPLFLSAMMLAPHPPLEIPEPWYSKYDQTELPENVGVWYPGQSPLQLYNLTGAMGTRYSREEWKEPWRVYLGLVSMLDSLVGKMLDALKEEGLYDDTLIVFSSDHGEMLGSHQLWQKMCMYEESAKIPLILKFPKGEFDAPVTVTQAVSAVDLLPTFCEYLGLPMPEKLSGISLLPAIKGKELKREAVFVQFDGNGARGNFQRAVICGHDKLIVDLFKDECYLELYDTETDAQEKKNLAFEPESAEKIQKMLSFLREHMKNTGDLITLPENAYEAFLAGYRRFFG